MLRFAIPARMALALLLLPSAALAQGPSSTQSVQCLAGVDSIQVGCYDDKRSTFCVLVEPFVPPYQHLCLIHFNASQLYCIYNEPILQCVPL